MSGKSVVVFGGAGYVGNAFSQSVKSEFDVSIADIRPPKSLEGLRFQRCDVREFSEVKSALSGASAALYFSVIQIPQINTEKRLGYQVNVLGLQNVCEAALQSESVKCVLHSGTWHVFGERGLSGVVDESYGFRPDYVEERARTYALCKIAQESIMRLYDGIGAAVGKTYGLIRMGTVLGENMPEATAAAIFIKKGLNGEPLTPYKSSMYRPMLYVDIVDICHGYANFVRRALNPNPANRDEGGTHIVNMVWPEPITILELAELVRDAVMEKTKGMVAPSIEVKDTGDPPLFTADAKTRFKVDTRKAEELVGKIGMTNPRDSIRRLVENRVMMAASKH